MLGGDYEKAWDDFDEERFEEDLHQMQVSHLEASLKAEFKGKNWKSQSSEND